MRYFYKTKDGGSFLSLKSPSTNPDFVEITEAEFERAYVTPTITDAEKEKIALREEVAELKAWFVEYDKQCNEYARSVRLGETYDKDIADLDKTAKANANRINEINTLLGE